MGSEEYMTKITLVQWHGRVQSNNDDYYSFIAYYVPGMALNASQCNSLNPYNNQWSWCSHLHFQWQKKKILFSLYCFMLFVFCLFEAKFSCSLVIWNWKGSDKRRCKRYQAFSSACAPPPLLWFQKPWWTRAHSGPRPAPCSTGGKSAFLRPLCLC